MTVACIYHSADLDGKCSAALIRVLHPDCRLIGMNYGEPFSCQQMNMSHVDEVYMVDFSLPWEAMDTLNECYSFHWIDHHSNVIRQARERCFLASGGQHLDTRTSACQLTFEYLWPKTPVPRSVQLLAKYDAWQGFGSKEWETEIMPFQCGMKALDYSPEENYAWEDVFNDRLVDKIIEHGYYVYLYEKQLYAKNAKNGCLISWHGHTWWAVNTPMAGALCDRGVNTPHDGVIAWWWDARIKMYRFSLRSDNFDVAEVAREYRGNGHPGAAGFQYHMIPFDLGGLL